MGRLTLSIVVGFATGCGTELAGTNVVDEETNVTLPASWWFPMSMSIRSPSRSRMRW